MRQARTAGVTDLVAAKIQATVVAKRTAVHVDGDTSPRKSGTARKTLKDKATLTKSQRGQSLTLSAILAHVPAGTGWFHSYFCLPACPPPSVRSRDRFLLLATAS